MGAKVVGLTISKEQRDFAQAPHPGRRPQRSRVEIRLQDYRDERDHYDRIASIEMIEAVGEAVLGRDIFRNCATAC